MKRAAKTLIAALVAASGVALVATSASAAIVCNREGECWHVHKGYNYQPEWGVVVHPNSWRWGANEHFRWREDAGRGGWRNGVWIRF